MNALRHCDVWQLTDVLYPWLHFLFQISNEGVCQLAEFCPQLKTLTLNYCVDTTDLALRCIGDYCHKLQCLRIRSCRVSLLSPCSPHGAAFGAPACPMTGSNSAPACPMTGSNSALIFTQQHSTEMCVVNLRMYGTVGL